MGVSIADLLIAFSVVAFLAGIVWFMIWAYRQKVLWACYVLVGLFALDILGVLATWAERDPVVSLVILIIKGGLFILYLSRAEHIVKERTEAISA